VLDAQFFGDPAVFGVQCLRIYRNVSARRPSCLIFQ